MTIKDFKRTQLLFGLFLEEDYSYDINKGKFYNEIKRKFKDKHKLVYISDPRIGDNMLDETNKTFKIVTHRDRLHFENNSSKENFIIECNEIVKIHNHIFENNSINKIGFIQHFEMNKKKSEFLKSHFFKNLPSYDLIQLDFHLNYKKIIKNKEYNFNLALDQNKITNIISGRLDMNITDDNLKTTDIKNIFDILDIYYKDEFINDFFVENGK
jgi:hypothetical protein